MYLCEDWEEDYSNIGVKNKDITIPVLGRVIINPKLTV